MVVAPLGLFDCCHHGRGCRGLLTTPEIAKDLKKDYGLIKGMGLAITYGYFSMAFQVDNDFLGFKSTREPRPWPNRAAGIQKPRTKSRGRGPRLLHHHELVNTRTWILRAGRGREAHRGRGYGLNGEFRSITSGGLKILPGHPVGATGVRMVAMCQSRCGTGRQAPAEEGRFRPHPHAGRAGLHCLRFRPGPPVNTFFPQRVQRAQGKDPKGDNIFLRISLAFGFKLGGLCALCGQ